MSRFLRAQAALVSTARCKRARDVDCKLAESEEQMSESMGDFWIRKISEFKKSGGECPVCRAKASTLTVDTATDEIAGMFAGYGGTYWDTKQKIRAIVARAALTRREVGHEQR